MGYFPSPSRQDSNKKSFSALEQHSGVQGQSNGDLSQGRKQGCKVEEVQNRNPILLNSGVAVWLALAIKWELESHVF